MFPQFSHPSSVFLSSKKLKPSTQVETLLNNVIPSFSYLNWLLAHQASWIDWLQKCIHQLICHGLNLWMVYPEWFLSLCSKKRRRPWLTKWWRSSQMFAGINASPAHRAASSAPVNQLVFATVLSATWIWASLSWNAFSQCSNRLENFGIF